MEYDCTSSAVSPAPCLGAGSASTSFTVNFSTPTAANDAIIVKTWSSPTGTAYVTVTDNASQNYTQDPIVKVTGEFAHYSSTLFYLCHLVAGIKSVTWTFGSGDTATYSWMAATRLKGLSAPCADVAANFGAAQAPPSRVLHRERRAMQMSFGGTSRLRRRLDFLSVRGVVNRHPRY